jgi:hypothetical protein
MAKATPDTILLVGEPNRRQREASATITPGHLLELTNTNKVKPHSTAGGRHTRMVAVENDIAGDDLDHDYSSGEVVQINIFRPGDEAYMVLKDGEVISTGEFLVSGTGGELQSKDSASPSDLEASVVGIALETKSLQGDSSGEPSNRIKVLFV